MRYGVHIRGTSPIIMHNGTAGLDVRSPAKVEIAEISRKRGSNRTIADDERLAELECQVSLWLDEKRAPTVPQGAVRSCIETAARKLKQGPQVREGLVVASTAFEYDTKRYGRKVERLGKTAQFQTPVVVQRQRILRTRAMFDLPWSLKVELDCDDELVDADQLAAWLDIAGRRIGLGDWRPQKSGHFGRFETVDLKALVN